MTAFALAAIALLFATLLLLVLPLWRGGRAPAASADRQAANLAIFRDQLAELDNALADGTLAEADHAQAKQELQRRLLEETDAVETSAAQAAPSRQMAIALIVLLPVFAMAGYGLLGQPRALDPAATQAQKPMTQGDVEAMVQRLADRLAQNPDDPQGWVMLGRSYKMMGRYKEAAEAYAKGDRLVKTDPELLASYAEALAMAGDRSFKGKPRQLIGQALKLDPKHAHSLFLAGAAAMEAGENTQAIAYWEALLPQVEPGSEIDEMLRRGITQMKEKAGKR